MAPPPELIDDAVAEILLRLPPDEPGHLFRAALVCKPWLRILCDPGFLRRHRAFHGGPPLLGLVVHGGDNLRFVSTTSVPAFPHPADTDHSFRDFRRVLDCRHGRVLLHMAGSLPGDMGDGVRGYLLVWDPVTGDTHALPRPGRGMHFAVSCDVQSCNHLDCHGGPFRVTFVATEMNTIFASMYTSEVGAWSTPTSISLSSEGYFLNMRGTVIGDEVHFALQGSNTFTIVKYDWGEKCLSVMKSTPPPQHPQLWGCSYYHYTLMAMEDIMAMEDSSLGLAICASSSLYIYSRKVNTDGAAQWVRYRAIDLEKVMPMAKTCDGYRARVVGFADGVGVILVSTSVGLFTIELKSGRVKKVKVECNNYVSVLPYMSFYTPGGVSSSSVAVLDYFDKPLQKPESLVDLTIKR